MARIGPEHVGVDLGVRRVQGGDLVTVVQEHDVREAHLVGRAVQEHGRIVDRVVGQVPLGGRQAEVVAGALRGAGSAEALGLRMVRLGRVGDAVRGEGDRHVAADPAGAVGDDGAPGDEHVEGVGGLTYVQPLCPD